MIDFTQPVLQACNVSVRAAFAEVKLLPGRQAVASVRAGAADRLRGGGTTTGSTKQAAARPGGNDSTPAGAWPGFDDGTAAGAWPGLVPIVRAAGRPIAWAIPAAGTMLIRLFACMLAALSATIAGRAGVAKHSRDRSEQPYRRRLES
jgi:hypothetical protein